MEQLHIFQRRAVQQLFRSRPSPQSFRQLHQISRQQFRTRPVQLHTAYRTVPWRQQARQFSFRRFASTSTATAEENLSLSQRLKKLSREYGWSAVGVYFLLSAADFPFCFLAVKLVGVDRIGHLEHEIVTWFKNLVSWPVSETAGAEVEDGAKHAVEKVEVAVQDATGQEKRVLEEDSTYVVTDHGYREAEQANRGSNASIWTQLALAYAIHKSFIFIRVPLTAAVTPKIVKTLRSWGWNIGKMPAKKGALTSSSKTGVNTKGSKVKSDD